MLASAALSGLDPFAGAIQGRRAKPLAPGYLMPRLQR